MSTTPHNFPVLLFRPRDVFGQVVRFSAAAIIFVRNDPSGDPTPSKEACLPKARRRQSPPAEARRREDIEITRRLREAGDIIGARILDHIVIGKGRYVTGAIEKSRQGMPEAFE